MSTYESAEVESTDVEQRTKRALTECMTVLPDGPDLFEVVGENENETYTVDLRAPACSCKDFEYRAGSEFDADEGCKHVRRARFADGREPVPDVDGVDPLLGRQTDSQPYSVREEPVAATDGGVPDHITVLSTLTGGEVYHCQTCGSEGDTLGDVDHHDDCPEASDDEILVAGDEGEVLDEEESEETDDDGRPEDCDCGDWNAHAGLPCWPCYRDSFEEPASAEDTDDVEERGA